MLGITYCSCKVLVTFNGREHYRAFKQGNRDVLSKIHAMDELDNRLYIQQLVNEGLVTIIETERLPWHTLKPAKKFKAKKKRKSKVYA